MSPIKNTDGSADHALSAAKEINERMANDGIFNCLANSKDIHLGAFCRCCLGQSVGLGIFTEVREAICNALCCCIDGLVYPC